MRLTLAHHRLALRTPWVAANGSTDQRELILVALEADDGYVGHGEAAPPLASGSVAADDVAAALQACRPALRSSEGIDHPQLLARCAELTTVSEALAGIDLALWDLAAKRAGEPVWRLLGAHSAEPVAVNATIASSDRAGAAREAADAVAAGFGTIKLKVGIGDDAGRLAAVRAAVPQATIRLDANGAWSVDQAVVALESLAPAGIELCEEPVSGLEQFAALSARTPVALALDETAAQPGALERGVCDSVCLKVSRSGGISGVLDAAARARAAGYRVYLASMLDGPLGIAAALHCAVAIAPDRPSGLATLPVFERRTLPLPVHSGAIAPPSQAGLGAGLEHWY